LLEGEAGLHATWVGRISIRNHTTRSFRSFEESEITSARRFSSRWRNVLPKLGLTALELNPTVGEALCSGFVPTTCFGVDHPSPTSICATETLGRNSLPCPGAWTCRGWRLPPTRARIIVPSRSGSFSHRPQSPFSAMARKRKLSTDRNAADAPFETVEETEVEETTDRAAHPLIEIVGETASEIDSTTTAHTELPSPPKEPGVYRLEHSTKNTHSSVICKLTGICQIPELLQEIRSVSVAMRQVQLEGCISPISTFSGASTMERTCLASSKCSSNAAVRPRSGTLSLEIELRPHPRIQTSTEPVCSTGLVERTRQRTQRSALSTQTARSTR
jgi:hypothetical protein